MEEIPAAHKSMLRFNGGRVVKLESTGCSPTLANEGPALCLLHLTGERMDGSYLDEVIAVQPEQAICLIAQLGVALAGRRYDRDNLERAVSIAVNAVITGMKSEPT